MAKLHFHIAYIHSYLHSSIHTHAYIPTYIHKYMHTYRRARNVSNTFASVLSSLSTTCRRRVHMMGVHKNTYNSYPLGGAVPIILCSFSFYDGNHRYNIRNKYLWLVGNLPSSQVSGYQGVQKWICRLCVVEIQTSAVSDFFLRINL